MFSFHKPKVYRSLAGCCICKAKSSSSRFTDSRRYESEFETCFKLKQFSRQGEICNACVLLVKRWKKLPEETTQIKDWAHMVDSRLGPGSKSTLKMKNRMRSPTLQKYKSVLKHRRVTVPTPPKKAYSPIPSPLRDDLIAGNDGCEENSNGSNGFEETHMSDSGDESDREVTYTEHRVRPRLRPTSMKNRRNLMKRKTPEHKTSPFLDLRYWKRTTVCCGIVFIGENNDLLVDPVLYRPCWYYKNKQNCTASQGFKRSSSLDDTDMIHDTDSNASVSECSNNSMDCNSDFEIGPESPQPKLLTDHDSKVNIAARLACRRSTKMEFDGDIIKC